MIDLTRQENISFSDISQQALENIDDLVRILDMEGNVIYSNRALKEFIGLDPTGTNCFYDEEHEAFICHTPMLNRAYRRQKVIQEKEINGQQFVIHSSPIMNDKDDIVAVIEVYHDITRERNMYRDLFNHVRSMKDDISFARRIQQSLLPERKHFATLDFDFRYITSQDLSGDIFDYFILDKDYMAVYICDVMGKGISASMMTLFVRQTLRSLAQEHRRPQVVIENLRDSDSQLELGPDKYFTIFYGLYHRKKRIFTYTNAGHNCPPAWMHDDKVDWLDYPGLPISEVFNDYHYEEHRVELSPGDSLLLYTDGVLEARNRNGEQFESERLEKILQTAVKEDTVSGVLDEIVYRVNRFGWGETSDDIALLLMTLRKEEL